MNKKMKNRPIRFRTWDTKSKKWLEEIPPEEYMLDSDVWDTPEDGDMASFSYPQNPLPDFNGRLIHQQFTGLIDKNKKEIYEGDFVKTDSTHVTVMLKCDGIAEYQRGEIRWISGAFKVCEVNVGACYISEFSACDCCSCGLEVVGNIFETKNET